MANSAEEVKMDPVLAAAAMFSSNFNITAMYALMPAGSNRDLLAAIHQAVTDRIYA